MSKPVCDLNQLLASMQPQLNEGTYIFSSVPLDTDVSRLKPIATFQEREGLTVIVEESAATLAALPVYFRAAWITLTVHSDLQAVGLTAAVAEALADSGISCNVVAGAFHDHIFVPVDRAQDAQTQLVHLQNVAQARSG